MHNIKDKAKKQLHELDEKLGRMQGNTIPMGDIEMLYKLTDIVKNIDKIEMLEEGDYSEDDGISYARGRRGGRRDSMGRYSREGGYSGNDDPYYDDGMGGNSRRPVMHYGRNDAKSQMIEKLEKMMDTAEDETQRQAIHRCMKEIERV